MHSMQDASSVFIRLAELESENNSTVQLQQNTRAAQRQNHECFISSAPLILLISAHLLTGFEQVVTGAIKDEEVVVVVVQESCKKKKKQNCTRKPEYLRYH